MKYLAIQDCVTVERDTDTDELLLKRLQKSVKEAYRQNWMRDANDLLLKAGITNAHTDAVAAFNDGLSPAEFITAFLRGAAS